MRQTLQRPEISERANLIPRQVELPQIRRRLKQLRQLDEKVGAQRQRHQLRQGDNPIVIGHAMVTARKEVRRGRRQVRSNSIRIQLELLHRVCRVQETTALERLRRERVVRQVEMLESRHVRERVDTECGNAVV